MAEKSKGTAQAYEAEAEAMRTKMARLRALRLARDAEQAAAAPPAPVAKKGAAKKKAAAKQPADAGTLADWIKTREDGGHNN
jgi:hypothetical protein